MTALRISLACFGFALLLIFGTALYIYQQLPQLLGQQIAAQLSEFGVERVIFTDLKLSLSQAQSTQIEVYGEQAGEVFEIDLHNAELNYDWQELLQGKALSLHLTKVDVQLKALRSGEGDHPVTVNTSSFFPQDYRASLPVNQLLVNDWNISYQQADATPIQLGGSLRWEKQLELQLHTELFDLSANAIVRTSGTNTILLELQLKSSEGALVTTEVELLRQDPAQRAVAATMHWQLEGELNHRQLLQWLRSSDSDLATTAMPESLSFAGASQFSATAHHDAVIRLSNTNDIATALLSQLHVKLEAAHKIEDLTYTPLVKTLEGSLSSSATITAGQLTASLSAVELSGEIQSADIGVTAESLDWLEWTSQIPFALNIPTVIELASNDENQHTLQVSDARLELGNDISQLHLEGLTFSAQLTDREVRSTNANASGKLAIRLKKQALPTLDFSLQQAGSLAQSTLDLHLADVQKNLELTVKGPISVADRKGTLKAELQIADLPKASNTLLPILQKLQLTELQPSFTAGSASLHSNLKLPEFDLSKIQASSRFSLSGTSGKLNDYSVEKLSIDARWNGIEKVQTQAPIEIRTERLNVGFDVRNIQAAIAIPRPAPWSDAQLNIKTFSAELFGGSTYLAQASKWQLGGQRNSLTLQAENWRLADIVALQQNNELRANGVLQGQLPLSVESGRLIIDGGYLRALPPGGVIQYTPESSSAALASGSKELALAMGFLRDFNYEAMRSDIGLDKAGNLTMGLSLRGKNPTQQDGRSVQFNINLEQNIDPMLQSLRMSDKLIEEIERRSQ